MINQFRISIKARTLSAAAFYMVGAASGLSAQVTQSPASSAQPVELSPEDAIRLGETRSEGIQIARAGLQRSTGQQYQARSQFFPQIYGSGGYTRTLKSQFQGAFGSGAAPDTTKPAAPAGPCDQYIHDANATTAERLAGLEQAARCASASNPFSSLSSLPFGQEHQYNLGLSFSQNLFAGGRIAAQNAIANAGHRSAQIELSAQRAQTILDITQAYYDAALSDRLAAIAESSFAQTESVYRQTQLNREVGTVSEFELLRASVSRDNQRPVVIQRRSDRDVAYLRLKQLLDIPLEAPLKLSTVIEDSVGTPAASRFANLSGMNTTPGDTAAAHRSVVRQAEEGVAAQEGFAKIARSQRLPSLSLTSQYGRVAYPVNGSIPGWNDFRTNWTVGVAAQMPIFTGGKIRGDEMVAQANLAESRARLQQTREYAALDARVALNALEQATAAWQASAGTAEQASRAYAIAEVRYREGISTQLELNDSRILLAQAQANRALAARNLQIARVRLALLPNLPLTSSASSQSAAQQAAASQQQSTQQTQQQNAATSNQQIPPGL
jgi:outer membrane protein TolC